MAPRGKGEQLGFEVLQPNRLGRQETLARLKLRRLRAHAGDLVFVGPDGDGMQPARLEILDQRSAVASILHKYDISAELGLLRQDKLLELRIVHPLAQHVDQVKRLLLDKESEASRIVVELA